jgi:hypothetical protein
MITFGWLVMVGECLQRMCANYLRKGVPRASA